MPLVSFGQYDGYELCYELKNRNFNTNKEAIEALQKILSVANLKTNRFVILPCNNINNAAATVYKEFRYILYNESWLSQSNYWSKMAVLAHEVGHHINGHLLSGYSLAENRRVELEADDWAGYAMAVLGASLTQTLELTKIFPEGDDTNSSHPNRVKRIAALTTGWNTGSKKSGVTDKPSETTINRTPTSNSGIGQYGSIGVRSFFYESPDVFSKPIKILIRNSSFEYTSMTLINNYFYRVKIDGKVGFIHKSGIMNDGNNKTILIRTPTSNTEIGQYGSIGVRSFFYESPDLFSKTIKILIRNSSFEYTSMTLINNYFYRVKINGKVGFIHKSSIVDKY